MSHLPGVEVEDYVSLVSRAGPAYCSTRGGDILSTSYAPDRANTIGMIEQSHGQISSSLGQKVTASRIPGPAGRSSLASQTTPSRNGVGTGQDEFASEEWTKALNIFGISSFDDSHSALINGTILAARSLQQSGKIKRLAAIIVYLRHSHTGECLIKLKDPTGVVSGTLTSDVLPTQRQHLTKGSVMLLENVTVLRTPPPHSVHHLCIDPASIVQIIPAARSGGAGTAILQDCNAREHRHLQLLATSLPLGQISAQPNHPERVILTGNNNDENCGKSGKAAAHHMEECYGGQEPAQLLVCSDAVDDLMAGLDDNEFF